MMHHYHQGSGHDRGRAKIRDITIYTRECVYVFVIPSCCAKSKLHCIMIFFACGQRRTNAQVWFLTDLFTGLSLSSINGAFSCNQVEMIWLLLRLISHPLAGWQFDAAGSCCFGIASMDLSVREHGLPHNWSLWARRIPTMTKKYFFFHYFMLYNLHTPHTHKHRFLHINFSSIFTHNTLLCSLLVESVHRCLGNIGWKQFVLEFSSHRDIYLSCNKDCTVATLLCTSQAACCVSSTMALIAQ